jgi:tetratricopeptide (TPR) repeat protein
MKTINKYKTLALANDNFSKSEFDQALRNYALVLKDFPNSKEAYNGAILAEMAMSGESGAEALFDYYEVLREEDAEQADMIISEILETMDGTLDQLGEILAEPVKNRVEFEDGILYGEFRELVEKEGDFKRIFENIMFSTRVIITEKEDFADFLDKLMHHGYKEMALSYLESALSVYPNDKQLRRLLRQLAKGSVVED